MPKCDSPDARARIGANMDEKNTSPEIKLGASGKLAEWLDNYWYHYKWHTVAVIFVLLVVIICTFQTCRRTETDIQIMYAGRENISMSRGENEFSEYEELVMALRRFVPDRDGDGSVNVDLLPLFLPSAEEIKKLEAEMEDGYELNYTLIGDNRKTFDSNIIFGDYYICLISADLLDEKASDNEAECPFVKITHYLPEGADYTYERAAGTENRGGYILHSEWGVYLSSTPLADKPGFSELPENTVIAMRKFSEVTSNFSRGKSEAYFRYNEDVLRKMLADIAAQ